MKNSLAPDLAAENADLRAQLAESEATLAAIRSKGVGALVNAEIRQGEALYRAIGESIDYGVWVCTPDGRNIYASPSFLKLVGITQDQCSNFGWGDVLHPDDAERTIAAWKECVRTGGRWDIEHRFRGVDGQWHYILARGVPVKDGQGQVLCWAGINLDVTERRRTEEALRFLGKCGWAPSGEDFFRALARYLAQSLGANFVCIDRLQAGSLAAQTVAVFCDGKFQDNVTYALKGTPCGDVVGKTICCFPRDVRGLFPKDAVLQELLAEGYLGTTLWSAQGQPIGLIALIWRQPLADTRLATSVLQLVAVRAAGELERRQAEAALRHSEQRLKHAQQIANVGSWEWDIQSGALWWSEQVYRQMGEQPGRFTPTHDSFRQRVHPEDRAVFEAAVQRALASTTPYDGEFRVVRPDGTICVLHSRGEVWPGPDGKPLRMVGVCLDVTERKRMEEAARESRERLALALLSSRMATFDWDIIKNKRTWSHGVHALLGTKAETFTGTAEEFFQIIHPEDRSAVQSALARAVEMTGEYETEYRAVWPDGSIRHISARGRVHRDSAGRAVQMTGVCWDITAHKLAEQALRESEQQFRTLADSIPNLAWRANGDGYITWYNRRWYEYTGTTPQQMEGWGWQSVHDPQALPAVLERWKASIATGQPFDMTLPLRGADGVFRPFLTRVMPLKDAQGRVQQWFGTNTDVSEQTRAEATEQRLNAELRQRVAELQAANQEVQASRQAALNLRDDAVRARHQAEQAGAESSSAAEQRRLALEAADLGAWDYHFQTGEVFWDARCREMWGIPKAETINYAGAIAAIHPEDRGGVDEAVQQALAGKDRGAYHREFRVIWPDGSEHWIASHGRVYFEGEGNQRRAVRFIGANQDITRRKQREAELHKLNRTLRAHSKSDQALVRAQREAEYLEQVCRIVVEDCGHAMVWVGFAEEDEAKTVRPAAQAGFEQGYLETLDITRADTERGRGPTGTAIRTGQPCLCRNLLTDPRFGPWRAEASKRGYVSSLVLPLLAEGRAFGALTIYSRKANGFIDDEVKLLTDLAGDLAYGITALRLRAAKERAEAALLESEARLAGLVGSAMDAILSIDAEQRIVLFNAAAEKMFGCPASAALGQPVARFIPEPLRARHRQHVREFGSAGVASRMMGRLGDLTALRADGQAFPIEASISQADVRGRKLFTVILRDVTERKRAQAALLQTTEDLKRSNRDLEQFAYVASHDLQEPLRAVGGYVKLLEHRFPDKLDAKARGYIAGAFDGATRMERLIGDLLAFSRVATRGDAFQPADLEDALGQALCNLEAGIDSARATVAHDLLPTLSVDAGQIRQLFQNLVGNALKFRGEQSPDIYIGAQRQEGRWVFSVRDNGIGIDPQYYEKIFQVFQRLHTRKDYPGTGIGLAICKKIVERHGGTIWVESQPGQGATFYFSIPDPPTASQPAA